MYVINTVYLVFQMEKERKCPDFDFFYLFRCLHIFLWVLRLLYMRENGFETAECVLKKREAVRTGFCTG